jgi:hypothetical protein
MGDGRNGANPAAAGPESPFLGRATPGYGHGGQGDGWTSDGTGHSDHGRASSHAQSVSVSVGGLGRAAREGWARPGEVAAWCSERDGYGEASGIPTWLCRVSERAALVRACAGWKWCWPGWSVFEPEPSSGQPGRSARPATLGSSFVTAETPGSTHPVILTSAGPTSLFEGASS